MWSTSEMRNMNCICTKSVWKTRFRNSKSGLRILISREYTEMYRIWEFRLDIDTFCVETRRNVQGQNPYFEIGMWQSITNRRSTNIWYGSIKYQDLGCRKKSWKFLLTADNMYLHNSPMQNSDLEMKKSTGDIQFLNVKSGFRKPKMSYYRNSIRNLGF